MFDKLKATFQAVLKDGRVRTAFYALVSAIAAVAGTLWLTPGPAPEDPQPPEAVRDFGWHRDPEAVEAVAGTLPFRVFSDTPAGKVRGDLPVSVYLWDAVQKVTGSPPPVRNQGGVGSCVSFGTNNAIYRSLAVDLALNRARGQLKPIAEEVTYGGSRVQIGKGKIRGDGSVGAWAAQFVQKWGVVPREKIAGFDLSTYSESLCRKWGSDGVPQAVLDVADDSPVKEITLVKTWADAKRAMAQGYGIAICSDQGFSMTRDASGVARAQGSWAHCMCLDGYHTEGRKEYGHITNSWGPDAHKGPTGWGNPGPDGFWADSAVVERMLKQGDSWAFSGAVGFPARTIDWFALGGFRDEVRPVLHADLGPAAVRFR